MGFEEAGQAYSDYDEQDTGDMKSLPNFIPPEAQKVPAVPAEPVAAAIDQESSEGAKAVATEESYGSVPAAGNSTPDGAGALTAAQRPGTAPEVKADGVTEAESEVLSESERRNELDDGVAPEAEAVEVQGDKVMIDRATLDALMGVAKKVNAGAMLVDPGELQRVNAAVQQGGGAPGAGPSQGQQQVKTGAQALAEGGLSLLGGAAVLTGAAFAAGGKVASSLAGVFSGRDNDAEMLESSGLTDAPPAGVAVLPRISEYRVDQADKAANAYADAMKKLWGSGGLPSVRKEIEERARQTGLSVEDVMDKMKPNGEMAGLHEKFRTAVAESPDAQAHKKAMDKALDGWVRQYGRGQEELLNPETGGNPHFEALRDRLDQTRERMKKSTANTPLFEGEERSHAEKLRETILRIMEKLKEIARDFVSLVRGKGGADVEADNAPSP